MRVEERDGQKYNVYEEADRLKGQKLEGLVSPLQEGKDVTVYTLVDKIEGRILKIDRENGRVLILGAYPNGPVHVHTPRFENIVSVVEKAQK